MERHFRRVDSYQNVARTLYVKRNGFSLIEMLLALALGGSVLLAAVSLITTFVELWEREAQPDWEEEGQVVAKKFLEDSLRESYVKLHGMYASLIRSKNSDTDLGPYWTDMDPSPDNFHLYWQNSTTPPFIRNPQGKVIEYHLEYEAQKQCVRLHYRLLPLDTKVGRWRLPATEHVVLFHHCIYFGYAYYTFDSDKWDIVLQPIKPSSGKMNPPEGFYLQFEDKTQWFIYLKKHSRHPFKAPEWSSTTPQSGNTNGVTPPQASLSRNGTSP
ncbi:MAG: prepilin-type N-terminal cleavage/methylation domain-containing protein [Puniceicoccales bacterium]|nr:prepilin-type N-terminal cleavage/methylation domain-containing protein [Puniceicoccales bacterium]